MTFLAADAFLYQGMPRWSFGMDNPNKAAAVLAFILILLLGALLRDPRGRVALLRDRPPPRTTTTNHQPLPRD